MLKQLCRCWKTSLRLLWLLGPVKSHVLQLLANSAASSVAAMMDTVMLVATMS